MTTRVLLKKSENYVFNHYKTHFSILIFQKQDDENQTKMMIEKYKIQPGTNAPLPLKRFIQLISLVSFNQIIINGLAQYAFYKLHVFLHDLRPQDIEKMPSFLRICGELLVFTLIEEIFFFYSHWALHSKYLYARFHKIHHEWTASVGLAASYMHPLEYFISDSIPNRVAPLLLASHPVTIWIWHFLANLYTINSHSGYHLPFLPSNENHDFHHKRFNVNYGSLGFLDAWHGTDASFKNSREFLRHVTLKSWKSARELFPDD